MYEKVRDAVIILYVTNNQETCGENSISTRLATLPLRLVLDACFPDPKATTSAGDIDLWREWKIEIKIKYAR